MSYFILTCMIRFKLFWKNSYIFQYKRTFEYLNVWNIFISGTFFFLLNTNWVIINKCKKMLMLRGKKQQQKHDCLWFALLYFVFRQAFLYILFFCFLPESKSCMLELNCTPTAEYSRGGVCVCGWAVRLCGPECWTLACPPQPAPSPDSHCQSAQMTKSLHVTNASHHTSTPHCFPSVSVL